MFSHSSNTYPSFPLLAWEYDFTHEHSRRTHLFRPLLTLTLFPPQGGFTVTIVVSLIVLFHRTDCDTRYVLLFPSLHLERTSLCARSQRFME